MAETFILIDRSETTALDDGVVRWYLRLMQASTFAVYMTLKVIAKDNRVFTLSEIAEIAGTSVRTVSSALAELESPHLRMILVERLRGPDGHHLPNRYTLLPYAKFAHGLGTTHMQNLHDTTTTIVTEDGFNNAMLWNDDISQGRLTALDIDRIHALEEMYTPETVRDAILEVVNSKVTEQRRFVTLSYLAAILERWQREGRDSGKPSDEPVIHDPWRKVYR